MERTRFFVRDEPTSKLGFKDGGVIHFLYMEIDGELVEVMKTADCPRHIVTKDKRQHFCVGDDEHAYPLPESNCSFMCTEVCQDKKRMLQKEIEEHGAYFDAKILEHINAYIAKDDTFQRLEDKGEAIQ